jgi:hypothetical protein
LDVSGENRHAASSGTGVPDQGARQLKNVGDTATDTATSLGHPLNHQQDLAIGR